MKRITVSLPDDLATRVEREAHRNRTSVSEVVRQSLVTRLGSAAEGRKRHIPFAGIADSGLTNTAERHDELLAEIYERRHADRQAQQRVDARDC